MSDLSNTYENHVANYLFVPGASPVRPTSHKVSLWSAVSDAEAGTGTELTGDGYARADATFSVTNGIAENDADVTFPEATDDWLEATHFAIHNHAGTAITKLIALTTPRTATAGTTPRFPAGDLTAEVQ